MRKHTPKLLAVVLLSVGALVFFAGASGHATPAPVLAAGGNAAPAGVDTTLRAHPRTSIPYGIDPELSLFGRRRVVQVTGHGQCPDEGEVDISVFVTEGPGNARALGMRTWPCPRAEGWKWTLNADALGPWAFSRSEATVCAVAVVRPDAADAPKVVENWCRDDVILAANPYVAQPLAEP